MIGRNRAVTAFEPRARHASLSVLPYSNAGLLRARNPRALNPAALPLQVNSGQPVYVVRVRFEYQGPAAFLQLGVGWKTGNFNFDHGAHLIRWTDGGFAFSNPIELPAFSAWGWTEVFFTQRPMLLSPIVGTNILQDGSSVVYSAGRQIDTWIWIYDTAKMGTSTTTPDTNFLAMDTDASVIQLKSAGAIQGVRSLDALNGGVEYSLA